MPKLRQLLVLCLAFATTTLAAADDRVTVAEVLPLLRGSAAGEVDLGPAPLPGGERVVRAREVRSALEAAGHDARGVQIPVSTKIRREAQAMDRSAIVDLVRPELNRAFFPCIVTEVQAPPRITLATGDVVVEATGRAPRTSGHAAASVVLRAGGRDTRLSIVADVECPAPVVSPGGRVQIVAIYGRVRASAPGTAIESGRVGDDIRVTNSLTRTTLRGRVVDANTVEVLQ